MSTSPANLKPTESLDRLRVPTHAVQQRFRKPKENVPQTPAERSQILHYIREYVAKHNPVPPLPQDQLAVHADRLVQEMELEPIYRDFVGVLFNNELWRESIAQVPFERRLLLLPKCLRVESKCPAPFDEFGLLCKQCGLCTIQDLQAEAEKLGYAVLVAEGSAIVMSIIQTGKIDAIVGVSCLSVLERAFPYMEAAAIPGVAVPLLQDDCIDTTVDLDWVWEYIHLTSEDNTRRLDLGVLRDDVNFWFSPGSLEITMGAVEGETERIAREWLMRDGKRWRPFLTTAAYQALRSDVGDVLPQDLQKVAVAVECFHKASLIHDDIEDNDSQRYGEKTLHEEYGVPVALNVGDFLIGEGYRLLASCNVSPEQKVAMSRVAADGQRRLCRGQGAELVWARDPKPMKSPEVLNIFRHKTSPAFEVALRLGAIYAGNKQHEEVSGALSAYSDALGVAYQIRDDLSDHGELGETNDLTGMRPGLLLAIAHEKAKDDAKEKLASIWQRQWPESTSSEQIESLYEELGAAHRANVLLETYKEEAIRSLAELKNQNLKGLLRRVLGKIFNDVEIKGWCKEQEQENIVKRSAAEPEPVTA